VTPGVVIAGIGQTAFGKLPGRSTISLNVEACREAIADAGIEPESVDGVLAKVPTSSLEFLYGQKVAQALGLQPTVGGVLDLGGASCIAMVSYAALAIGAGMCHTVVVTCADNPRSGTRGAYDKTYGDGAEYGWSGVAPGYALITRRHMIELGTTEDDLAAVAVACRAHGAANRSAQLRKPISVADHHASPAVVDPLRRDDCALVSDGGAAVVIMREDLARRHGAGTPVPVLGFGQGHVSWDVHLRPTLTETLGKRSAEMAFAMAGLTPSHVDVAELYDCFTIAPLMALEEYGFCARGEVGDFVRDGGLEVGGNLPMNTSGGLLSETGMPGMQLILEGVRQIRGDSCNQVKDAGVAVISGQGGIMHTHASLLVGG
jgi:acetyl-CoA acetyltransferase